MFVKVGLQKNLNINGNDYELIAVIFSARKAYNHYITHCICATQQTVQVYNDLYTTFMSSTLDSSNKNYDYDHEEMVPRIVLYCRAGTICIGETPVGEFFRDRAAKPSAWKSYETIVSSLQTIYGKNPFDLQAHPHDKIILEKLIEVGTKVQSSANMDNGELIREYAGTISSMADVVNAATTLAVVDGEVAGTSAAAAAAAAAAAEAAAVATDTSASPAAPATAVNGEDAGISAASGVVGATGSPTTAVAQELDKTPANFSCESEGCDKDFVEKCNHCLGSYCDAHTRSHNCEGKGASDVTVDTVVGTSGVGSDTSAVTAGSQVALITGKKVTTPKRISSSADASSASKKIRSDSQHAQTFRITAPSLLEFKDKSMKTAHANKTHLKNSIVLIDIASRHVLNSKTTIGRLIGSPEGWVYMKDATNGSTMYALKK